MAFRIRQSKYRHIYADQPKVDNCWTGFRLSTATGEQQYIKASAKYFAVSLSGGGGPVAICSVDQPGRFEPGTSPVLGGHSGNVLDFDWNPFDDSMIATGSEDCSIKLWSIPDDWAPIDSSGSAKSGTNLDASKCEVELTGHRKKVTLVRFHPTASFVLASASADMTLKVWDVESGEEVSTCEAHGDLIHDFVWDHKGENIASSCKDKNVRIINPRTGEVTATIEKAHDGSKSVKICFVGDDSSHLITVGFNKQSSREIKLWNISDLSKPVEILKLDSASGAFIPLYDYDTKVLYMAGKGDGNIRYYEIDVEASKAPYIHALSEYRSTKPGKGYCVLPKRGLNIMECETARIMKLTPGAIEPLSFTVPRKSDAFQDDIFPDTNSLTPAHSAEEWIAGSAKEAVKTSLNPKLAKNNNSAGSGMKKPTSVKMQLAEANARIKFLEEKLKEANIEF